MLAHIAMVAQGKLAENRHSPQSPHLPYLPCAIKSTEIHFACPAFPTRPACRGGASRASRAAGQVGQVGQVGQEGQSHCHVGPPKNNSKTSGTKWDVSMSVLSVLADLAMPAWVTDDEGTEAFGPLAVGHEVGS